MKQHRLYLLLGVLGLVMSITLVLAIAFVELRNRDSLTTKIQQAEDTAAAENTASPSGAIDVLELE